MNKNNFMKAMSMIDEELIKEADTPYEEKTVSDNAAASFSENDDPTAVSGVEVYRGFGWRKFLGAAAAVVLVLGAVGGGAYYFSKLNDAPVVSEEDENADTSIYERIKAAKDSYDMSEYVWNFSTGANILVNNKSSYKNKLFDYLDSLEDVKEVDDYPTSFRSVRFSFTDGDKKLNYDFSIRENGYGFWQVTDPENTVTLSPNKECFYYGKDVFEKLLNEVLKDADSDTVEAMSKASQDEIMGFVSTHLEKSDDKAVFSPLQGALEVEMDHYIISDKADLTNALMKYEWVKIKESEFVYNNYYEMGIRVSEDGYLMAVGDDPDPYGCYKLKNKADCEKLSADIKALLEYDTESDDASSEDIKEVFSNIIDDPCASTWEGTIGIPQGGQYYGTIYRNYNISDAESFINEIASLEWVTCSDKECEDDSGKCWNLSYTYLMESGYIDGRTKDNHKRYFKLKNERDKDKIHQITDKYITMMDTSQLAEKLRIGIDNYDNLESDYVFEGNDGYSRGHSSLRGHLWYDAKNHKMYMNGEGTYDGKEVTVETVMNGEDVSAYRIIDKTTGEAFLEYTYCIVSPMIPRSPVHYVYSAKSIERILAPAMVQAPEYNIESRDIGGGKTEYQITGNYYDSEVSHKIVLTEGGQLISSESNGYSFRLENYVFDSPDFTMEDVGPIYESIEADQ